jgi:hypothetical protein
LFWSQSLNNVKIVELLSTVIKNGYEEEEEKVC